MGLHFGRNTTNRELTANKRGNCTMQGCDTPATHRRSTSHGANPHHHRHGERQGHGEPGRSAREQRGAAIARQLAQGRRQSTTLFAQQQPRRAASVQNSPRTSRTAPLPVQNSPRTPALGACPVQNSPRSPAMAPFGAIYACRESFVPRWSAQH